ncbi:MAG: family 16 glycosylhydrolase [Gammaproteobacteria bacterium]|nr:family 16 glycosylhydrolase [Gammaproteobacteria bacterium]
MRTISIINRFCCLVCLVIVSGCAVGPADNEPPVAERNAIATKTKATQHTPGIATAINVGGPEHLAADGIRFQADELPIPAMRGNIAQIKGTQDPTVFKTYREGDLNWSAEVPNGLYDLTFLFAEPKDTPIGERVFDIVAEGRSIIESLDVRSARDGNIHAGLNHTAVDVEVLDGSLDVQFNPQVGQPILNGIIVREKTPRAPDWALTWADEFDYQGSPDPSRWSVDVWPAGKVNREDQAYTDDPKNLRVEDGKLIIEAHLEDDGDARFTSGRIHSANKRDMLYGRIETRAKLPGGQGTWAAIWMLPTDPFRYASNCGHGTDWQGDDDCDAWPNSGEIDIMEHVGYDMNRVHGTVHTKAYYWVNGKQRKASIAAPPVDKDFHVYAMEWTPDRIDIFYDDTLYFSYLNEGTGWEAWPFDHPHHLILNLAVGGDWGRAGGPIDEAAFPAKMEIDYVRFYERGEQLSAE